MREKKKRDEKTIAVAFLTYSVLKQCHRVPFAITTLIMNAALIGGVQHAPPACLTFFGQALPVPAVLKF